MNLKKLAQCCTLGLIFCLFSATVAQAGGIPRKFGIKFPEGFRVKNLGELVENIASKLRRSQADALKAFQEELEQAMEKGIITEQDLKSLGETTFLTQGPTQLDVIQTNQLRQRLTYNTTLPSLPNGLTWEGAMGPFGGNKALELLKTSLYPHSLGNEQAALLSDLMQTAYTGMVQEQMAGRAKNWELYTAVAPVLQRYIYIEQIPITENSILATKGMMERAPHFVNAISVVSLSEWMAQHDFMFPSIGIDPDLNVILAGLTRKTLNHELSTEASQFLLDCYLYAANAHDIDKVMRGITNFYKQHHRIPGLGRLAITKEHSIKFYKAFNAGTIELSSQELGEMNQAIPAIFLAYHLPGHPLWQKLPEETRNRVMEVRRTIESQLKPTRDPSQEFPQERK